MKILVVDDVADNLELMRRWLTRRGHEVLLAPDGQSGIDQTKAHMPDLVFMDISMPEMSGVEAMQLIRKDPSVDQTNIVALTAHALSEQRAEYLAAGANEVETKPIDFSNLKKVIERFDTVNGGTDGG